MDDLEQPITGEEIKSELSGLNSDDNKLKKKQVIIGVSVMAFLIVLITIILIIVSSGSDDGDNSEQSGSVIGEINCVFEIENNDEKTKLFGDNFQSNSGFKIFIDDIEQKYEKAYKFSTTGNHKLQIKLYKALNMDYMFEGVEDLISVQMNSTNNTQITSMESTFENCIFLKTF